jgi:Cu+-exporting ATPase
MKRIALAALVATFASAAVFAADPSPKAPVKTAAAKPNLVCPVTGEKIASVADAVGSSVYKGKTYYFCCAGCKPMFDKSPAKYVKTASAAKASTKTPAKAAAAKTS